MSENAIKEMIEKSKNYDLLLITTKGYAFDSLIFRFKEYQAKAFESEVREFQHIRNCSDGEARKKIKDEHDRDLMRFIQILDSVIGEHD